MKRAVAAILMTVFHVAILNGQFIISEFLADPANPLESEWIEIYNYCESPCNLSGWSLCDLVGCAEFPEIILMPEQYFVLCQDSGAFASYYFDYDGNFAALPGWRALNNSGDLLMLKNADDTMTDSIPYSEVFGSNISRERIALTSPGWQADNWNRSLDKTGSTPGKANSVAGGFPGDFKLTLTDILFSPGGMNGDQYLELEIALPRNCLLTLTVYSTEGRKVRTIFNEQSLASGQYQYDGSDEHGRFLAIGLYILLAEVGGDCAFAEKYVFGVAK